MKLFGYHLRKDGCYREVPQHVMDADPGYASWLRQQPPHRRNLTVLRLLFEWPWQKKDPMLKG